MSVRYEGKEKGIGSREVAFPSGCQIRWPPGHTPSLRLLDAMQYAGNSIALKIRSKVSQMQ